jgi:hypothetical protein
MRLRIVLATLAVFGWGHWVGSAIPRVPHNEFMQADPVQQSATTTGDSAMPPLGAVVGRVVKNAPYSATETHIWTIHDGTTDIHITTIMTIARDSEGRSRYERTNLPSNINIFNPTAGVSYVLDPKTKTAWVTKLAQSAYQPVPPRNQSVESLGTQTMEGLTVVGDRTTTITPAGEIGNDLPIKEVVERWYSPELHIFILNQTFNPRSGDNLTKVTDIDRSEPDPTLFVIPQDYKVLSRNGSKPE